MTSECAQCRRQNEQFTEFTHIVSHDLQSPVNKIISFLDLLKQNLGQNFDLKSAEYLERINKNAATLTLLMKKLRDYAHAASTADPVESVDLNQTLAVVQQALRPDIDRSRSSIAADALPSVRGRAAQLQLLLQNLVSNAITHRTERAPSLQIRAVEQADEWRITLQDNGPGVRRDDYVKIFQLFPRMENQPGPSTATGLAIAKKIVENHGGRIWVESDPPNGSTFLFTLPRN